MPDPHATAEVTRLLHAAQAGDDTALERLFPLVYDELRALARRQRGGWRGQQTLNTTALVHEAYLRLQEGASTAEGGGFENRAHFLGVAAKAMRHILVDYARRQQAQKRGGDQHRVDLDAPGLSIANPDGPALTDLLALDGALDRLAERDARAAQIVECRFFADMTIEETAAVVGVSTPTVKRSWRMAQAWLYREMQG
ncbi:MAG: sigma-70 family RNA polymerase sigma factor [Bacteroidota bacterium]